MASFHDASFYCITRDELPTNAHGSDLRDIYVKVSVTSACLGIFGAIWQLISWKISEDQTVASDRRRRPVSPTIAVSLALANFLSCIGVIARATGILLTSPPNTTNSNEIKPEIQNSTIMTGTAIEVFTNWMYAASVMWTLAYAVDVYCHIKRCQSPDYKLPNSCVYHLICWGIPALTTTAGTLAIWVQSSFPGTCAGRTRLLWRYLFSYIPMVIVLLVNPIIYWRAHTVGKNLPRQRGTYTQSEWDVVRMLKVRFLVIVTVYTICWLPNIADSIVQLTLMEKDKSRKGDERYQILFPLWILEAILNPLQGLFNCILYRQGLFAFLARKRNRGDRTIQSSVEEHESRLLLGHNQLFSQPKQTYT